MRSQRSRAAAASTPTRLGVPVIGVYRWLPDRGAGLIAEMSQDEAFGSARQLALAIGVVGLVSAVLLAGGIWFVARRVTRPILSLAATATRVRRGDLEARRVCAPRTRSARSPPRSTR